MFSFLKRTEPDRLLEEEKEKHEKQYSDSLMGGLKIGVTRENKANESSEQKRDYMWGTLGIILSDKLDNYVLLSNYHVLYCNPEGYVRNYGNPGADGDYIVQPFYIDPKFFKNPPPIAQNHCKISEKIVKFDGKDYYLDAATAILLKDVPSRKKNQYREMLPYRIRLLEGKVTGYTDPVENMNVIGTSFIQSLSGRILTQDEIEKNCEYDYNSDDVSNSANLRDVKETLKIKPNLIPIVSSSAPTNADDWKKKENRNVRAFSASGESGSLIVVKNYFDENFTAVGLLFKSQLSCSYACHMKPIVELLNLRLDYIPKEKFVDKNGNLL